MSRIVDATYLSEDEGINVPLEVGDWVEGVLKGLELNTYDKRYMVHLTVHEVDAP